jgi:hypothetical protein
MNDSIIFKVGNKYENMKGVYEVISIDDELMTIRWDNGEQISTPTDLQRRIIERIQFEKERLEQINNKSAGSKKKRNSGKAFSGFDPNDFKNSISHTNWRNRTCLGGAVAKKINSENYNFNSWAVSGMPAVHWCDVNRRKQKDEALQANFYAQVDDNNLYYGLCIEKPDSMTDIKNDWDAFLSWLENEQNETWLNNISQEKDLCIIDSDKKSFNNAIKAHDDIWKKNNEEISSLSNFFNKFNQTKQTLISISKIEKKKDIIAEKWTNTSGPSSCSIKPNPFLSLNHLTLPFAIKDTPFLNTSLSIEKS